MVGKDLHSGLEARLQQLTSQNTPVARLARKRGRWPQPAHSSGADSHQICPVLGAKRAASL